MVDTRAACHRDLRSRRRRRRARTRVVDARDVAGVLGGQHRTPCSRETCSRDRRTSSAENAFRLVEVRVEHELRAVANGPSNGRGITPALVTDRDAERERSDLEHATSRARRVPAVLARIELGLSLEAHAHAPDRSRARSRAWRGRRHASVEHGRDPSTRGGLRSPGPRALEKRRIGPGGGWWPRPRSPRDVTLGKADHVRALDGGSRDRVAGARSILRALPDSEDCWGDPGHDATVLCERGHRRRLLRSPMRAALTVLGACGNAATAK